MAIHTVYHSKSAFVCDSIIFRFIESTEFGSSVDFFVSYYDLTIQLCSCPSNRRYQMGVESLLINSKKNTANMIFITVSKDRNAIQPSREDTGIEDNKNESSITILIFTSKELVIGIKDSLTTVTLMNHIVSQTTVDYLKIL